MINIEEFKKDLKNLQELQVHADRMQNVMIDAANDFNKKYKGTIFQDTTENREYKLNHADGWQHNFSFDLHKIRKKRPFQTTMEYKYVRLKELLDFPTTGETMEDRQNDNKI